MVQIVGGCDVKKAIAKRLLAVVDEITVMRYTAITVNGNAVFPVVRSRRFNQCDLHRVIMSTEFSSMGFVWYLSY